jgi:tetratricopeptide (TPR) repeat protein
MEWSYELLSVEEQALFRRECVFAGAFDLEAAEEVATAPPIEPFDVLEMQAALVDKSFIATESVGSGLRYRLAESLRAYGREQLRDFGEEDDMGERHALHYVTVARRLRDRQRAGDAQGAVQGLEDDEDHFRAALRLLLDRGDVEPAAEIIGAVGFLWYLTGSFREGIEWCRELFAYDLNLPDALLASVLHVYGTLLRSWVHPAEGMEMLEKEVEIRRKIGDDARLAAALNNLGNMQSDLGHSSQAEATLREAIHHFTAAGESAALSYCTLAWSAFDAGRLDEATEHSEMGLSEASAYGDPYGTALAQTFIAWCSVLLGRTVEAWNLLERARTAMLDLGVRPGVGQLDLIEGQAHLVDGDAARAAASLIDALREPDTHWYPTAPLWAVQLGISLTNDHASAAELVGAIERQYADADTTQPLWVREHLDTLSDNLERDLGSTEFAKAVARGRRMSRAATIATGRDHLSVVVATSPEKSPT